jgi:hypothetical protein
MRRAATFAILVGGLTAGVIDILYAVGFSASRGVPPMRILQSVASGLLGSASYQGGAATAALGLLLHFLLMLLIAAIFHGAATRWRFLAQRPVVWGALYGVVVYWVMNLVVLPLSAFPGTVRFVPVVVATSLVVHAFGIGVPIALATRKALRASA